jgi:rhodanese-related sulfurtransferase
MYQNVNPQDTYAAMKQDPAAQMIDCRTQAEWRFVGTPDLSSLNRELICLEWVSFDGQSNSQFSAQIEQHLDKDTPIYILCRSGVRSAAACEALVAAGFTTLFNVAGGFEGNHDEAGHRGTIEGWKADKLPWRQP